MYHLTVVSLQVVPAYNITVLSIFQMFFLVINNGLVVNNFPQDNIIIHAPLSSALRQHQPYIAIGIVHKMCMCMCVYSLIHN